MSPADPPPGPPALVLFDLDGTLVDSGPGIRASVRHAAAVAGLAEPTAEQLRALIGPPFPRAFVDVLGVDAATADVMMAAYRDVYGAGELRRVEVYPGVREALADLADAGHPLAVTTSKPTVYAAQVVEHIGLTGRFDTGVFGASLDGTVEGKAAVVGLALAARPGGPVAALVGDRDHDVHGAHAHGLRCVGVTWGFGGRDELVGAGADEVVDTAPELLAALTGPVSRPAATPRSPGPPAAHR